MHEFTDRHGRPRVYLRRRGFGRIPLPWPIGSREFVEAYQAALGSNERQTGRRVNAGSINALVQLYYASNEWAALAPQSQRTYRHILEHFREEHGELPVTKLEREHVKAMVCAKAATPAAANKFRKLLSVLMHVAVDKGWRKDNPVTGVKGIKSKSQGFQTWSEAHIACFEARHAVGTKARLALELSFTRGNGVATWSAWGFSTSDTELSGSGSRKLALKLRSLFTTSSRSASLMRRASI